MNLRHIAVPILSLWLASCASYTPSSAPVPEPGPTDWVAGGTVAVAAEAFSDQERQKANFDADFDAANVVAIQLVAENRGARKVLVRPSDMALQLPQGRTLAPSGVTTVVSTVGESGSVVAAALAFGIVGALAASSAEEQARTARTADYTEKAFKESTLGEAESAHGFVFFIPPPGTGPFDSAILRVRFVDIDSATSEHVEVPLAGLAYQGAATRTASADARDDGFDESSLEAQGFRRLGAEEIRTVLFGNTLSGQDERRGNNFAVFTEPDGSIRARVTTPGGKVRQGKGQWRLTDDDMICEHWQEWRGDCDRLYLKDDRFVFVNSDGSMSSSGVVSQGNPKGL